MKVILLKIIQFLLIILVSFLFLFLVNKNFSKSGQMVVKMELGTDLPMITKLGPEPRVVSKDGVQTILESPVYFDLRSMPWFKKAVISLVFKENGLELDGIAGQASSGWQYGVIKPFLVTALANGFKVAIFSFDLAEVYQQKNIRRFLISLKPAEAQEGKEFKIQSLEIILSQ